MTFLVYTETSALHFRNVVMGRQKSKYMLPFRVKYHFHFQVCSSLPQNPLVENRKKETNSHISDCKAIFFLIMGRFQQKFKQQIAFIKTNNFGPAVTVKNTPITCFNLFSSFFSIFRGVSCKKLNFRMKMKIIF